MASTRVVRGSVRPGASPGRRTGALFEYLLAAGICGWFATVELPLVALSRIIWDPLLVDANTLRFVPIAVALLLVVDLAFMGQVTGHLSRYGRQNASGLWWMVAASVAVFIGSLIHGFYMSVLYSIMLLFVAANMAMLWVMNVRVARLAFRVMFVISALTAILPLLLYGGPVNRVIGGIHPNSYGAVLLGFAFSWVLGFDRFNAVGLSIALGLAILVSSRYTFLALALFSIFVLGFDRRISAGAKVVLAITGLFVLLLPSVQAMVSEVFLIGDYDRGLGAGVSGRFELYSNFMPQIERSPWIGYGFRARDEYEPNHNAFLTTLLENGVVIGGILFAWVIARFWQAAAAAVTTGQRIYAYVAGGLISVAAGAFFQPQLFNFGDPMGLSFLLFLVAPIVRAPPARPLAAVRLPAAAAAAPGGNPR